MYAVWKGSPPAAWSWSGIVTFNIEGVFPQDTSIYLNSFGIAIRAGNHCAKVLKDELNIKNTCRVSLYFYNTKNYIFCQEVIQK